MRPPSSLRIHSHLVAPRLLRITRSLHRRLQLLATSLARRREIIQPTSLLRNQTFLELLKYPSKLARAPVMPCRHRLKAPVTLLDQGCSISRAPDRHLHPQHLELQAYSLQNSLSVRLPSWEPRHRQQPRLRRLQPHQPQALNFRLPPRAAHLFSERLLSLKLRNLVPVLRPLA